MGGRQSHVWAVWKRATEEQNGLLEATVVSNSSMINGSM